MINQSNTQTPPLLVMGAGAWGTALALLLSQNNQKVLLWGHDENALQQMANTRENKRYLPGILFNENLLLCFDLKAAIEKTRDILVVVPSLFFSDVLTQIKPWIKPKTRLVWGTKGLCPLTSRFLSQVAEDVLGKEIPTGVLSGPSFAEETAKGQPTAITLASHDPNLISAWMGYLHHPPFRVYPTDDLIGVQTAGVVKNILAIAAGIAEGLGFGANTRAALITRGLSEMTRLGIALGGKLETFLGLAGVGDLILTCTTDQSRNRRFGVMIGKGTSIIDARKQMGSVIEGAQNAKQVFELAQKHQLDLPICAQVYRILYEQVSPKQAVEALLAREIRI